MVMFSLFFYLTVDPLELTDYHYSFLGSQEYQPREEPMSIAPIEDDKPRTLIPSKLGKQAGGWTSSWTSSIASWTSVLTVVELHSLHYFQTKPMYPTNTD